MPTRALFAAVAILAAWPAWARDVALVIGNENYRRAPDVNAAEDAADWRQASTAFSWYCSTRRHSASWSTRVTGRRTLESFCE